ncbi:MAG: NAD(P)H-dependent oxidoreductase subunit E [Chloroflexota bacterium]|nr:NAD(P)H-dependent oxidoreductase subunit E [Chloroflexota bacterium]MCY3581781.1 NAD(P)H-dependent oxidoreductase subunit E [Chloroflexota bacterium]MDE2651101.1 NAD(P)H-dependent oxidoreductase subunit E [Chloroflexota bacterium]MXX51337.1 NADH-quinone oxidoreductase subunit E [Chloroflexota bacterium]MXX84412.1 NADH-quinone oxidoreductase subunit E [Chloroflexota bacterium]
MNGDISEICARYQGRRREALLPLLWDVQMAQGSIGPAQVQQISHTLRIPEADIFGVIGFYTLFHAQPTGRRIIRVCADPACALADADSVLHELCARLHIAPGETTADGEFTIEHSLCLGLCDLAPAALLSARGEPDRAIPQANADSLLAGGASDYFTPAGDANSALLAGGLTSAPQSLADYGDYAALRKARAMTGDRVIAEIEASGLIGRGGAAFPTGLKWKFTRAASGAPKYIVCNADESEPGTFKDRVLMEHRPHLLLEGIALAAYAVGTDQAIIFIRGEYPHATQILQDAIAEAEAAGLLGGLTIEVRRGAGAYICGEETALFEAIEGKRGFPRMKPPYPTTFGLFGKPTAVNNVETLCAVPPIITRGADWFRSIGTAGSAGPKLVSVSGHVARPGVYEIAPGLSLRDFLEGQCGGVTGQLQAVLMGGAAGTFLRPGEIDVPLTFEDLREAGSTFGSGAIMVFNDTVDLRDMLLRLGRFFQHESCGKCFPCQLGTQRQVEILKRLDAPLPGDRERLRDIGMTMTEASICGLGHTAGMAVMSAMEKFPGLFEAE